MAVQNHEETVEMDRVHLIKPGHTPFYVDGHMTDTAIHVHDVVDNGQSFYEMTGEHSKLKPITFDYLKKHGYTWKAEKVHVKSHTSTHNGKAVVVHDYDRSK